MAAALLLPKTLFNIHLGLFGNTGGIAANN
jgi:hypothetical protein